MLMSILLWLFGAAFLAAILVLASLLLATLWIAAKAERLVPPVGKFVEIDGNRIHYIDVGQGRPIVFVHGLGAQLHHFRHTVFGRFGPGYRLIALDRPGSGYSTRASGATGRLPEQAEIIRRFIESLGLERPLVVGHSLGGAITLTLAVEHPNAISGIALLAPLTLWRQGRAKDLTCCTYLHACCGGSWPIPWRYRQASDMPGRRWTSSSRRKPSLATI